MKTTIKNFEDTAFAHQLFMNFESLKPSMKDLIAFHKSHKFFLQSKDELLYRKLGKLVGNHDNKPFDELLSEYKTIFLQALSKERDAKTAKNALQHMAGFIKTDLTKTEKTLLHTQIDAFANKEVSITLPLSTLRSYALKYNCTYLLEQSLLSTYLEAFPPRRILWFRRDLRTTDNPLLCYEGEVLPIFIFDSNILDSLEPSDKRVSYVFYFVSTLKQELIKKGLDLKIFYGKPKSVFEYLNYDIFDEVIANVDYDSYATKRDAEISALMDFKRLYDTYIFEPNEILKKDLSPYLVFTPFYNKALDLLEEKYKKFDTTLTSQTLYETDYTGITSIKNKRAKHLPLTLESIGFREQPVIKTDPHDTLDLFVDKLKDYKEKRDYLDIDGTSSLSVALRFGTLSVREILREIKGKKGSEAFIRQLIFRDFYAYLLYHFPSLEHTNYKYRYNGIEDPKRFEAFCKGETGVPIIDAGVRELLQTGKMHNRVRMITASFFTKDLLLPWQWGEAFFAKYLLDYDAASNILSWQWSSGTGIDPQPYFRIFNPYLQAKKFDKNAHYIKRWIHELANLEAENIHDEAFLKTHRQENYPTPIIDHTMASKRALDYFKSHR
ncbi:MAG: DUF1722 domain-containing protein [Sulfurospirillaceae bacterium]|nr:DUF1722 domain-containing protein [Sulfurospirillaceae bacterium]